MFSWYFKVIRSWSIEETVLNILEMEGKKSCFPVKPLIAALEKITSRSQKIVRVLDVCFTLQGLASFVVYAHRLACAKYRSTRFTTH